jgi:hypothetical protein
VDEVFGIAQAVAAARWIILAFPCADRSCSRRTAGHRPWMGFSAPAGSRSALRTRSGSSGVRGPVPGGVLRRRALYVIFLRAVRGPDAFRGVRPYGAACLLRILPVSAGAWLLLGWHAGPVGTRRQIEFQWRARTGPAVCKALQQAAEGGVQRPRGKVAQAVVRLWILVLREGPPQTALHGEDAPVRDPRQGQQVHPGLR